MSEPQPLESTLSADFWEGRYQEGTARWDLGQPAPPFVDLLNSSDAPKPGRIAVLGSGKGHDALLFAAQGFEVVGFDFAPSAIRAATTAAQVQGLAAQFYQRDIFELVPEFADSFDYVLEHTCFCAILPEQRSDYVRLVKAILHPGGELIGLFWAHNRTGGPPFGVSVEELRWRFESEFEILSLEPASHSVEGRRDEEYLTRLRVRKAGTAAS